MSKQLNLKHLLYCTDECYECYVDSDAVWIGQSVTVLSVIRILIVINFRYMYNMLNNIVAAWSVHCTLRCR